MKWVPGALSRKVNLSSKCGCLFAEVKLVSFRLCVIAVLNVAKIKIIMQTSLAQIKLCKDPCEKLLPDRKLQKLGKKFIHSSNDKDS